MPFINSKGHWCGGVGGGTARWGTESGMGNVLAPEAGGTNWLERSSRDPEVIYQSCLGTPTCQLIIHNVDTGAKSVARPVGANFLCAGGGVWAAWLGANPNPAYVGVAASTGLHLPNAGLLGISHDGAIGLKAEYQSEGPNYVKEKNGDEWSIAESGIYDLQLLGNRQAVWRSYAEQGAVKTTPGVPVPVIITEAAYFLKMAEVDGKWYVCYASEQGLVIHPAQDGNNATILHPEDIERQFYVDFRAVGNRLYYAYAHTQGDEPVIIGSVAAVGGTAGTGSPGTGPGTSSGVGMTLKSEATYPIADKTTKIEEAAIVSLPAWPVQSGRGRIVHPLLGAYDYEVKPDQWTNMDADVIIPPVWASTRTMTGAINVLWKGNIRDVVVEERWLAPGGISMPISMLRMLYMIWTNPLDPQVGFVQWFPNYISPFGFKVIPMMLDAGGQALVFDDIVNYEDGNGPNGWVSSPVTLTLKMIERLTTVV